MTEETQVAVAETKVETTSEEVDQKVEAPVQKSDVDKKKLLFAASVLAVAAKLLIDKAAKKKVVAPPAPEYDIKCLPLQGVAKKTGIPLMCFKIPKKMGKHDISDDTPSPVSFLIRAMGGDLTPLPRFSRFLRSLNFPIRSV